jgi:hypothetical protein
MSPFAGKIWLKKALLTVGLLSVGLFALTLPNVNLDNFQFSDGAVCDLDGSATCSAGKGCIC